MKIGSLCTGYGGLDMAVQDVLGGEVAWHCQYEPPGKDGKEVPQYAARILDHHWPEVPNHGDITKIDWDQVEPVDVVTAGFPCQDVSIAGRRAGMTRSNRSGLWHSVARAIAQLRPKLVVIENVRGLLSSDAHSNLEPCPWCVGNHRGPYLRALGAVLGDLAELGFDAEWVSLDASQAGAPHQRRRVIVLAWPFAEDPNGTIGEERWTSASAEAEAGRPWADTGGRSGVSVPSGVRLLPTPTASNPNDGESLESWEARRERNKVKHINGNGMGTPLAIAVRMMNQSWVTDDGIDYGSAIRHWEALMGRLAPCPTEPGARGNHRLNPVFAEWMMGIPAGHVTAVPGIPRSAQLHAIGNGVVPQQAELALRSLLGVAS